MAWLGTWANRIKLVIEYPLIDETLTNFPVMIKLSTSSGRHGDDVTAVFDELASDANRKKIAVTTSDGQTQCYVEIEKWDDASELAILWTKVPSISSTANTILYLYYDSAQSDNTTYVGDTNSAVAQNVWDANYLTVHHLADDNLYDSTGSNFDGTNSGSVDATGKCGQGRDFERGDPDYVDLGDNGDINGTSFTASVICKFESMPFVAQRPFQKRGTGAVGSFAGWQISTSSSNSWSNVWIDDGAGNSVNPGTGSPGVGVWYQVDLVFDTTTGTAYFYVNGELKNQATTAGLIGANFSNARNLTFGCAWDSGATQSQYMDGIVDEGRLSNTDRSAAYIKAQYHANFDTLLWFDPEIAITPGDWNVAYKIKIDNSNIDSALSGYPLFVYLSASSGTTNFDLSGIFDELTSDANRKKIAVTTSDGVTQCYVEIELWDDANEVAYLWVKVPDVDPSDITELYIYADAGASDNTDYVGDTTDAPAKKVWDGGYVVVYHMAQDPNGDPADAIKDSSANGYHQTPYGTMTSGDLVTDSPGLGIDFDGSNDRLQRTYLSEINESDFALEAMCNVDDTGTGRAFFHQGDQAVSNNQGYSVRVHTDDSIFFQYFKTGWRSYNSTLTLTPLTPQYAGFGYDDSEPDCYFYVNASAEGPTSLYEDTASTVYPFKIAAIKSSALQNYFPGIIGELRLSSILRSAAWHKANYYLWLDNGIEYTDALENVAITADPITITLSQLGTAAFDIFITASPINVSLSKLGTYHVGEIFPGSPINITLSNTGGYIPGVLLSTEALITLGLSITSTFKKQIQTDWKKYRGEGVWDFTEQPTKIGYINNTKWSEDDEVQEWLSSQGIPTGQGDQHLPCGHWHKAPLYTKEWVQQVVGFDEIDSFEYDGVASANQKVINTCYDDILIVCYDGDNSIYGSYPSEISTVQIDSSGNLGPVLDNKQLYLAVHAAGNVSVGHVCDDIYFCTDNENNQLMMWTFRLGADGSLTQLDYYAGWKADKGYLIYIDYLYKAHDNVICGIGSWNISGQYSRRIWTHAINSSGIITHDIIDYTEIEIGAGYWGTYYGQCLQSALDSNLFIFGYDSYSVSPSWLNLVTVRIDSNGVVSPIISWFPFVSESSSPNYVSVDWGLGQSEDGTVILVGTRDSTQAMWFKTYSFSSSGNISASNELDYIRFTDENRNEIEIVKGIGESFVCCADRYTAANYLEIFVLNVNEDGEFTPREMLYSQYLPQTGVNAITANASATNLENIYVVVYEGAAYDGWAVSLEFILSDIRRNASEVTDPLEDEPQVWPLEAHVQKFGFLNNERWAGQDDVQTWLSDFGIPTGEDKKHKPCGHWHKEQPFQYVKEEYWPGEYGAIIDNYEMSGAAASNLRTVPLSTQGYYMTAFVSNGLWIKTYYIDNDGYFTAPIDTWQVSASNNTPYAMFALQTDDYYVLVFYNADASGAATVATLYCTGEGIITKSWIDTFNAGTNVSLGLNALCNVTGATWALAYATGSTGKIGLLNISPTGIIYDSWIDNYTYISGIYQGTTPTLGKIRESLFALICNSGSGAGADVLLKTFIISAAKIYPECDSVYLAENEELELYSKTITSCDVVGFKGIAVAYTRTTGFENTVRTYSINDVGTIVEVDTVVKFSGSTRDSFCDYDPIRGKFMFAAWPIRWFIIGTAGTIGEDEDVSDENIAGGEPMIMHHYQDDTKSIYLSTYRGGYGSHAWATTYDVNFVTSYMKDTETVLEDPADTEPVIWPMDFN